MSELDTATETFWALEALDASNVQDGDAPCPEIALARKYLDRLTTGAVETDEHTFICLVRAAERQLSGGN